MASTDADESLTSTLEIHPRVWRPLFNLDPEVYETCTLFFLFVFISVILIIRYPNIDLFCSDRDVCTVDRLSLTALGKTCDIRPLEHPSMTYPKQYDWTSRLFMFVSLLFYILLLSFECWTGTPKSTVLRVLV